MSVTVKSIEDGNTSALESHDYDNVVRKLTVSAPLVVLLS